MPESASKPPRERRRSDEADFWERLGISGAAERIAGPMTRREKWLDFGKTKLWVVPLTALIWIWAEREQIAYGTISNVPVKFVHASPDRMVSIVDGDGKISVDVRGPRASIEALRDRLSEGSGALIVTLTDPTLYDGEVYTLAEMIARN